MDPSHPIDGQPSVRVLLGTKEGEDELYMSCLYGSFRFETGAPVSRDEVTRFRCPHCRASLVSDVNCDICGAPTALLELGEDGNVRFCARRGCKGHHLLVDDPLQLLDGPTAAQ